MARVHYEIELLESRLLLAGPFSLGDRVVMREDGVNVRATPNGTILGTQILGRRGNVVGGPSVVAGFTWYNTNWDAGVDGWSADQYVEIAPPLISAPGSPNSPGPVLTTLTPTFTWGAVTGAEGYGLYIRDLTTNTLIFNNDGGRKTGTSYSLPSGYLVPGHAFRWAMTSYNGTVEGIIQSDYLYFQTQMAAAPSISSISPQSMPASNSLQDLTINGSNFTSTSTLTFDPPTGSNIESSESRFVTRTSTQIVYQINNGSDVGLWQVRVNNPDGQQSNWGTFHVVSAAPAITGVSPNPMPGSNSLQNLTIDGSNFTLTSTLTFDPPTGSNIDSNESRFVTRTATQIVYQINNANDLGTWQVRVNNPDGQQSAWASFDVVTTAPHINGVSPTQMQGSNSLQNLTISGSNFTSTSTLTFDPPSGPNINSTESRFVSRTATQIVYLINNAYDLGTWQVRVNNPDGQMSNWGSFDVVAPVTTLSNNVAVTGLSDTIGGEKLFKLNVPSGASNLRFQITGNSGDADLYVRFGALPTTQTYDYRPFLSTSNETVAPPIATTGDWYVMIRGYTAYSGVTLVGSYATSAALPAAPTNVVAAGVSTSQINLTWDANSTNSNGFKIERKTGASGSWAEVGIKGASERSYWDTGLTAGTLYFYRVRAYNQAGNSEYSNESSASTQNAPADTLLSNNVPINGLADAQGGERFFKLTVPTGAQDLRFEISGGTGDADLYVRFGSRPTVSDYDYRERLPGNSAAIRPPAATAGDWYVMVRGYSAYSGVSLTGSYTPTSTSPYLKDSPELLAAPLPPAMPVSETGTLDMRAIARTYNRLGGLMGVAAAQQNVEVAAVLAVWYVESRGRTFTPNQMVVRFENHWFYKLWGQYNQTVFDQHFQFSHRDSWGSSQYANFWWQNHTFRAGTTGPFAPFHIEDVHDGTSQMKEYQALGFARGLNEDKALQSVSMGGPQILGVNYSLIGYSTARDMYDAFQSSERPHVLGFFDYLIQRGALVALRTRNWQAFATKYNGGGIESYRSQMASAYLLARQVLGLPGGSPLGSGLGGLTPQPPPSNKGRPPGRGGSNQPPSVNNFVASPGGIL